jgi:hypothetical protein
MRTLLTRELPVNVEEVLGGFVQSACNVFGEYLSSILLFGSAAEGRLRPSSDVNVLVVLRKFDPDMSRGLAEALQKGRAAIRLSPMFLLEAELQPAMEAFAVKFGDIARRHVLLHGTNPFQHLNVPRAAAIARLKQVLLNLTLRMRDVIISRGDREEQMVAAIADTAGPLRACAATVLEIRNAVVGSPKEALVKVAFSLLPSEAAESLMKRITEARIGKGIPPGGARSVFCELMELAHRMLDEANKL